MKLNLIALGREMQILITLNHLFYMDDLKLYARDANDLEDLLKTVECSGDEKETN